jgi:Autotransporter beta-domain
MRILIFQGLLLLVVSLFSQQLAAQEATDDLASDTTKWEFGPRLGALVYQGDLVEDFFQLRGIGPQGGLYGRRFLNEHLTLEAALGYGTFKGWDDPNRFENRLITSKVSAITASLSLQYDIRIRLIEDSKKWGWSPYASVGIGGVFANFKNTGVPTTSPDSKVTSSSSVFVPVGGGLKFFTLRNVLSLDVRFNPTNTDLLEGVSESGNAKKKDTFATFAVSYGWLF